MIIKQEHKALGKLPFQMGMRGVLILGGISILLVCMSYIPRSAKKIVIKEEGIYCGAEELVFNGDKMLFQGAGALFENAESQSDEIARSGSYSSKTDKEHPYGMFLSFSDAQAGDIYQMSIWRYGNKIEAGRLIVNIDNPEGKAFYKQTNEAVEVDEREWEKLEIIFKVPDFYQGQGIKIYPMGGSYPLYFDDFQIKKLPNLAQINKAEIDTSLAELKLKIDDYSYDFLKKRRQQILSTGIYFSEDKDWVKARILGVQEELPAKLRFKGDWMDHIKFDKWSFRIRMKEPHAWNRFTTFSIQRPENRAFIWEWLYHKFLEKEDVLSPRYDFVKVSINNEEKGIYAIEEHFEKILPEFRARREGPILKFSEDGVWNARKRFLDMDLAGNPIEEELRSFESAQILPFQASKILANPALKAQFLTAQKLLRQFKEGERPVSDIFDLEKLAKYYAITDLCQAFHSSIWHNQRFYYNPLISKLEPIAYDGYTETGIFNLGGGRAILGSSQGYRIENAENELMFSSMKDTAFVRRYHYYLDAFSKAEYLDKFILEIEPALEGKIYELSKEYTSYSFNVSMLKEQARRIRGILYPLDDNSIRVFRKKEGGETKFFSKNYHHLPLEIISWSKGKEKKGDLSVFIRPFDGEKVPELRELPLGEDAERISFRLPGLAQVYQSQILPWSEEDNPVAAQELFTDVQLEAGKSYQLKGKEVRFLGQHQIEEDIIIPAGYEVIFMPGCQLDFVKQSSFISRSAIHVLGEAEKPVHIFSSDKSSKGFTVMQAEERSRIQYALFENLGALEKDSWRLTGAISFYESDLDMRFCSVINNHSEDAINLVRSDFSIENSLIQGTFSDGLDTDFCKGEIRDLVCKNTGNDALDFSGSRVNLHQIEIENPGDKGISIGEESHVIVYAAEIAGAKIALASKDLSKAEVRKISARNCNIVFSAYQKKPEFGPALISVDTLITDQINYLHLIEKDSKLKLKGKLVETL
ncbi:MAG: CotH kinase family protein [Bacteroidota bacterium]